MLFRSAMKILRCALVLVLVATPCLAQDVARMEQLVQSEVDSARFMGTVLIARGDDIIVSKGYGSANLEWDVAAPQALGMTGVWIDARGRGVPEHSSVRPDHIIRSLAALRPLIS